METKSQVKRLASGEHGTLDAVILNQGRLIGAVVFTESKAPGGKTMRSQIAAYREELEKLDPTAKDALFSVMSKIRDDIDSNLESPNLMTQVELLGSIASSVGFSHGFEHAKSILASGSFEASKLAAADTALRSEAALKKQLADLTTENTNLRADMQAAGQTHAAELAKVQGELGNALKGKADAEKEASDAQGRIKDVEKSVDMRAGVKALAIEAGRGLSAPIREEASELPSKGAGKATDGLFGLSKTRAAIREQLTRDGHIKA